MRKREFSQESLEPSSERWGGEGIEGLKCPHLSHTTSCHGPLSSPALREKTFREILARFGQGLVGAELVVEGLDGESQA